MHAVAEADPLQKICHILPVVGNALADDAQGKGDVLPRRQVVEQAEVLEHDADAPAQLRALGRGDAADVLVEAGKCGPGWAAAT